MRDNPAHMEQLKHYLSQISPDEIQPGVAGFLAAIDQVYQVSPKIAGAILQELDDQRSHLKLIASENFSSLAVQLAMGNLLTDKYSEGYVHHRFYAGCENVDTVEEEATNLACRLFNAEHAYVQPHSGADANLVAFWSILVQRVQNKEVEKLGKKSLDELSSDEYEKVRSLMLRQKLMGLSLNSGGHLTHGFRHNVSSKMMQSVSYDVNPATGLIDYDDLAKKVKAEKPDILLAGYSAYPRLINFAKMREMADSVGAVFVVDMAHFAGLVAGGVFTGDYNPIPHAHLVTTTTHKTLRGPRGGMVLCKKEWAEVVDKGCPLVLGGPLPHVMAAKAVAFTEALHPSFKAYATQIVKNAKALAEELMREGASITTGGTDNHLMVINVSPFKLTGRQAESALREAGITVNRNAIPFDPNGAWYTSGVRIGTPAVTTLGMKESEMKTIAKLIIHTLQATQSAPNPSTGQPSKAHFTTDAAALNQLKKDLRRLLQDFPLYPQITIERKDLSHAT